MRSRTRQVRWFAPCCLHSGVNSAVPAGGTHTLSSTVPRTPSHVVIPWLPVYPLEFPFSWQINVIVRPQGRIRARFQVFSLGLLSSLIDECVASDPQRRFSMKIHVISPEFPFSLAGARVRQTPKDDANAIFSQAFLLYDLGTCI